MKKTRISWCTTALCLMLPFLSTAQQKLFTKHAVMFPAGIFNTAPPGPSGIIGTVPGGGDITATVYEFDPTAANQKGFMLYRAHLRQSSTSYNAIYDVIRKADLGTYQPYFVTDWNTGAIDQSLAALRSQQATNRNRLKTVFRDPFPVIIEISTSGGSVLSSLKIPGIPAMGAHDLNHGFQDVLDAFKNPLSYPDYYIVAAHRGYWKDVPENSKAAYDLTVASGADMVELDTRLTKDDTLVAFHDECLDRITTGSGKLRDMTWAQVQQLNLKDRFGKTTNFKMVSIREALLYLKGRAIVNLDLKERITKNADGSVTDLLTPTFKAALKIAKETGTLNQLVLKGKLPADDLQDVLQELDISLNDFFYTPVGFGWDTPKMDQYVTDWLNEGIPGIELTYKVAYDPILKYIPQAINRNIRAGIYTMWPEDANGVIAEDNINTNNCKFNYRQYFFLNEDGGGTLPKASDVSFGNRSGEDEPADEDYGGGSYNRVDSRPRKLGRPEFMNDGRGDWDWTFKMGANFIITDRPVLMVQYLENLGRRKLEKAVITEETLPDCAVLSNGTGGNKMYNNFRGMVRKISDYRLVDFFVPDTRNINVDTAHVVDSLKIFSNGKTKGWVVQQMNNNNGKCNCPDLFRDSSQVAPIRRFPMRSLPEWSVIYPNYDIYINTNWFDVKVPWPLDRPKERKTLQKAPYKEPCTDIFGFLQPGSSQGGGSLLTRNDNNKPGKQDYDGLVLDVSNSLKLVHKDNLTTYFPAGYDNDPVFSKLCVGGYILAENGNQVPYQSLPDGVNRTVPKKRSVLGIKGNEVYIVELQAPMLEPYEVSDFMVKVYGCKDVFMFDAGGSVSMLSTRGMFPSVQTNAGPYIASGSAPEDRDPGGIRRYRPVPTFLAVKVKNK